MKYIVLLAAACLGLAACSTDIEQPRLAAHEGENYPAPTLADFADIFVNVDNSGENVSFVCSLVDFGASVPVSYRLYLEAEGYDAIHVASSYVPTITLTKADLNGRALNSFGATDNEPSALSAYVIAYAGESEIHTEPSNVVTFNITTYKAPLRIYYICGVFNGWGAASAPEMYETGAGTNKFAGVYYLTEESDGYSPFKILPVRDWNGDMGYDAFESRSANISKMGDTGNLAVPVGIWQITADIGALSIDAKQLTSFYVTGGNTDWKSPADGSPIMLEYDPATNVWKSESTIPAGTEFKVCYTTDDKYGNITWLGDTGKSADNMPEGLTEAWELLDDQGGNITAPAGDKYVVVYADRTPWVIAYE